MKGTHMNNQVFESTKLAAYFLWEYTNHNNALSLWQCAENIANYFHNKNLLSIKNIHDIIYLPKNNPAYVNFIRNISFRIFIYTNNFDDKFNWFTSEKLVTNSEWLLAVLNIANKII